MDVILRVKNVTITFHPFPHLLYYNTLTGDENSWIKAASPLGCEQKERKEKSFTAHSFIWSIRKKVDCTTIMGYFMIHSNSRDFILDDAKQRCREAKIDGKNWKSVWPPKFGVDFIYLTHGIWRWRKTLLSPPQLTLTLPFLKTGPAFFSGPNLQICFLASVFVLTWSVWRQVMIPEKVEYNSEERKIARKRFLFSRFISLSLTLSR